MLELVNNVGGGMKICNDLPPLSPSLYNFIALGFTEMM